MPATDIVHVFAINEVLKTSLIDGGDTLAIQLRDTGGDEIAILASMKVAHALYAGVEATLSETKQYTQARRLKGRYRSRRQSRCSVISDAPVLNAPLVFEA